MRTVCGKNKCNGCYACISKCSKNAIHIKDNIKTYHAVIDETLCVNCGQCENVCPVNHSVSHSQPVLWRQGWAADEKMRSNASSGGLASALAIGFIHAGGVVCSCVFDNGEFVFDFADTEYDAIKFAGSKYVKSNPDGVYKRINQYLAKGKKVLFIGLPCQVAGVRAYTKDHALLYTVDLICHGTPSPKTLQMFLREKGLRIEGITDLRFRKKTDFYLSDGNKSIEPPAVRERYTMAFLGALCYTENCYSCEYATTERVSDITLGDSWGSQLPEEEQKKGISLILCQNEKGKELLSLASLHLEDVDVERAVANNRQLNKPSNMPKERNRFFQKVASKNSFTKAVSMCYPRTCFRQDIKSILISAGFIRGVIHHNDIPFGCDIWIWKTDIISESMLLRFQSLLQIKHQQCVAAV